MLGAFVEDLAQLINKKSNIFSSLVLQVLEKEPMLIFYVKILILKQYPLEMNLEG